MENFIDLTPVKEFFRLPLDILLWDFLAQFGWIIFAILFLLGVKTLWLKYVKGKWSKNIKHVLLAIDVPKGNIQSPQAVENLFSYLGGAHGTQNFFEKWFLGEYQLSFSFEIVSLDGYTQFLIRTPKKFVNLVESAVYSQYPDAEIIEVDDYCEDFPRKFPDDEYDIWGSEFIQSAHYMYPIKTYREFEHRLGPEEKTFKDPMAELMELCSSLRRGENLLYQIIVIPTGFDWVNDGDEIIGKILGRKPKVSFLNKVIDLIVDLISDLSEMIYTLWGDVDTSKKDDFREKIVAELPPKQQKRVEAIEHKSSKLGFLCKIRVVYLAKKEVINKSKVAGGFVGYIKQFSALDLNSFKPDLKKTATKASYFNKGRKLIRKKNNIINNYIDRNDWAGRNPFLLNIEELATIWHFPFEPTADAPLIQKTSAKKYKPPVDLSLDDDTMDAGALEEDLLEEDFSRDSSKKKKSSEAFDNQVQDNDYQGKGSSDSSKKSPPPNLPLG